MMPEGQTPQIELKVGKGNKRRRSKERYLFAAYLRKELFEKINKIVNETIIKYGRAYGVKSAVFEKIVEAGIKHLEGNGMKQVQVDIRRDKLMDAYMKVWEEVENFTETENKKVVDLTAHDFFRIIERKLGSDPRTKVKYTKLFVKHGMIYIEPKLSVDMIKRGTLKVIRTVHLLNPSYW